MDDILKQITDYIFIDNPPQRSDVIIVAGGSLPQLAERSAELYRQGYAPFVIAGGRYGVKHGRFVGVGDKAEIYDGVYETECDFECDVLIKNGVPTNAIIREDKSMYTRQNAEFAYAAAKEHGIIVNRALVVCKGFHSRRCYQLFTEAFRGAEIIVCAVDIPAGSRNVTRSNWHTTDFGIQRVIGELQRCNTDESCTLLKSFESEI